LEQAEVQVASAMSALDRAAQKGIIHKNNAARRKSRLVGLLRRAQAAQ
jgi:small subunit ribosomal protein S20